MCRKDAVYRERGWLFDQYHVKGKNLEEVAKTAGCSPMTVLNWMMIHKIERRPPGREPNE